MKQNKKNSEKKENKKKEASVGRRAELLLFRILII